MRPLTATINLLSLKENYQFVKQCAPNSQIFSVVKANAYGHGLESVVLSLVNISDGFAVACIDEALRIRKVSPDTRILILEGCFNQEELQLASEMSLDIVLHSLYQVEALLNTQLTGPVTVWLKFDTGMHRLGFNLKNLENIYIKLKSCAQISSINLISHFACADELENSYNQQQIKQFNTFSPLTIQWRSLANSAAIMSRKESHFDWVRPGIMLYGVSPFSATVLLAKCLKPVMSLSAQIIAIHQFEEGDSIGYGRQWIADKSVRVGVVSCGYADGYPRQVPSGTSVLVRGKRVPLVGCVSMDMLTIDLSTAPEAHVGDLVQLWGEQILVNEIAESVGSIGYEVLSKVTSRVKRCYIS